MKLLDMSLSSRLGSKETLSIVKHYIEGLGLAPSVLSLQSSVTLT